MEFLGHYQRSFIGSVIALPLKFRGIEKIYIGAHPDGYIFCSRRWEKGLDKKPVIIENNRMVIPLALRKFADIAKEVMFVGFGREAFALYNPNKFKEANDKKWKEVEKECEKGTFCRGKTKKRRKRNGSQ